MKRYNIVLGGGIAGLIIAKKLINKGYKNILLIESSDRLGGLLKSDNYPGFGSFDYGTHYFTDTYGEEINSILLNTLDLNQWNFHKGVRSDLSGLYHNGQLNLSTVFVDLKSYSKPQYTNYLGEIFANYESNSIDDSSQFDFPNAHEYLTSLYGLKITEEIFDPILRKLFKCSSKVLSPFVVKLFPLSRLVMFSNKLAKEVLKSPLLNKVAAFPDQLTLPKHLHPNHSSYYPKQRGLQPIIDALENQLLDEGVTFKKSTKIKGFNFNKIIEDVVFEDGSTLAIENVYSTISLLNLAPLLGIKLDYHQLDFPRHTVLTHLMVKQTSDLNERHYLYCYDEGFNSFRITNYNSLCISHEEGRIPLTVESLYDQLIDPDDVSAKIVDELVQMKILKNKEDVLFKDSHFLNYGFPLLTLKNTTYLSYLRFKLEALGIRNLNRFGIFSDQNVFFMKDVFKQIELNFKS